jgi:rubredoxin
MIKCPKCKFEGKPTEFKKADIGCASAIQCPKCGYVFM